MAITLEDGTEWKVCIYCTECTAANVYATPEILDGLEHFETATGMEARRHLSAFHSTFSRRLKVMYSKNEWKLLHVGCFHKWKHIGMMNQINC